VDLIVKALKKSGHKVKFLYFWDSYDRFRKVPAEVPENKKKLMQSEIGKPVCDVIDPWGCHESWAEHWMTKLEKEVARTGIKPDYIRQHVLYKKCLYAKDIKKALHERDKIKVILNKYRKEPLANDWYPITIYCEKCMHDFTKVISYDGSYTLSYECACGHKSSFDFRKKGLVKLRWRVDWPMRWAHYGVGFEPAGKEHMVMGSSRTTGKSIVRTVYESEPPYGFMYGLVRRKGGPGKMSASSGDVIFVSDALNVYLPEVLRYIFVGNRPTADFAISFDEDVLKIYEDFYQCEDAYYDKGQGLSDKRIENLKRVYELSVLEPSKTKPVQMSFRTAALIVQTAKKSEWLDKAKELEKVKKIDESRVKALLECADHWVKNHAPEQYKIIVNSKAPKVKVKPEVKKALNEFGKKLLTKSYKEDKLNSLIFEIARPVGIKDFFKAAYQVIISKNRGPKLAPFIISVGQKKIGKLLSSI
jgi:lysyl-tRNA synthetase class 1